MIVVVGNPAWRLATPDAAAAPVGRAASIAIAAAGAGARVELVGRAGDDDAGDRLLIALAAAGVGHVALLRDPARGTVLEAVPAAAAFDDEAGAEPASPLDADDMDEPDSLPATPGGGPVLEAADVAMGLRYLTDFTVLVFVDRGPASALPVVVEAAAYAEAHLIVLVPQDAPIPDGIPADATALAAPSIDRDGAFARLVGTFAAALDRGEDPSAAFRTAVSGQGWEPA